MSKVNEAFVAEESEGHTTCPLPLNNENKLVNMAKSNEAFVAEETEGNTTYPLHHDNQNKLVNLLAIGLARFWKCYNKFISKHARIIKILLLLLLFILILLYVGAVIRQFQINDNANTDWCRGYGMAFIVFGLMSWTLVYYTLIVPYLLPFIIRRSHNKVLVRIWRKIRLVIAALLILLLAVFLIWDTSSDRRRLISVGGLFTFIVCGFIFSKYPTHVKWSTVFMGLTIQFTMGLFAIRWSGGRQAFKCVGGLAEEFLEYSYVGASLVYGERIVRQDAVFAFQALSAIFFVSMIVQVLFYLGWMQIMCLKLGWLVQTAMGTTVMESVNAVSSVFLGMTEAPLLYKPYIKDLTPSEVHAVMAGGFSTIAGTVFAAYAAFGVNPADIITASMMSAPAALCYAKLVYPENSQSKTDKNNVQMFISEDKSVMDAAIQGALIGISMVQGIIATVIACVSIVAFFNDLLAWAGLLAGIQDFTLETIFSYLLFPIVWLMGVEPSQCLMVARLIGIKITVNEFIAYSQLGELKKTGLLSRRSEAITTYALCSFANPGSVGILISTLTTLAPSQRYNIIAVSFRAFASAVFISFLTACIAGALMPEEGFAD